MLSITDDFRIIHHMFDTASAFGLSQLQLYKDLEQIGSIHIENCWLFHKSDSLSVSLRYYTMVDARASEDEDTSPFLVRLFHRTGSFYRPEEFASASLPPHVSIYTWSTCTLYELALELTAAKPSALPSPAIGTRLSFQLVCPDLRGNSTINAGQPKFAVKELGSIVIGEGYPGAENPDDADPDVMKDDSEKDKTLADWRFVVGDYISCAILPPLSDGSVAPPSNARRGSISSGRESRGSSFRGGYPGRDSNFSRNHGRQSRAPSWRDNRFPSGDWRRGEQLPEGPPGGSRGRGRWY
ncbi:Sin3 associated polypeptide p18-domain-containing protein [Trichoderma sp. SZMC 28011]